MKSALARKYIRLFFATQFQKTLFFVPIVILRFRRNDFTQRLNWLMKLLLGGSSMAAFTNFGSIQANLRIGHECNFLTRTAQPMSAVIKFAQNSLPYVHAIIGGFRIRVLIISNRLATVRSVMPN